MSLLIVTDLKVSYPTADGVVQAVRDLSYSVDVGETLGIVGESGSGKSVSALSMLGLNSDADISGSAIFEGKDLLSMPSAEIEHLRGAQIAMIFQDPLSSLHPQYRVGWQISEAIRAHTQVSKAEAWAQSIELLRQVEIARPDSRVSAYPHELSGGMRQRVMIAMAIALHPKLLIADEPTTALDATVQAQLLDLLVNIQKSSGMAMLLITHDLGVIARVAANVLVMYAGRAVEFAEVRNLFYKPHHPYTRGLLTSIPSSAAASERLKPIVGQPPSPLRPPSGCAFHLRCPFAMEMCIDQQPPAVEVEASHTSECFLPPTITGLGEASDAAREAYAEARRGPRSRKLPGVVAARGGRESAG